MLRGNKIRRCTETNMYASIDALATSSILRQETQGKSRGHHAGDVIKARSSV